MADDLAERPEDPAWVDARFQAVFEAEQRFAEDKATRRDLYLIGGYRPGAVSGSGLTLKQADALAAQRGEPPPPVWAYNRALRAEQMEQVRRWHAANGTVASREWLKAHGPPRADLPAAAEPTPPPGRTAYWLTPEQFERLLIYPWWQSRRLWFGFLAGAAFSSLVWPLGGLFRG